VIDSDGTDKTDLTGSNSTWHGEGTWSPDGTKISYVAANELHVMNPDGTGKTNLTNDGIWPSGPAWSPDGAKIAYTSDSDLYLINADGTGLINLTNGSANWPYQPTWSPDGTKIVYAADSLIYIINSDGTGQTELTSTHDVEYAYYPRFSPDGSQISYIGENKITITDVDGSNKTVLAEADSWGLEWSTEGTRLSYVSDETGVLHIINIDGTGLTSLPSPGDWAGVASWSPVPGAVSVIPATPTPVPSPTPSPTPMPPGSYLSVHSDEQYQGWITGDYYPCTSTPCGHLDVTTWYGGEIYVKISGQSTDPADNWYWAYIYKHSESTWVIQYVMPVLDVWSPHNGLDESEPWMGDWGKGMTVDLISP